MLCLVLACSIANSDRHWKLAEDYSSQGQYLQAIEEYSRIVNLGEKSALAVQAEFQIAEIYDQHLKDYSRAIRAYREVYSRTDQPVIKMNVRWAIAKIYSEKLENPAVGAEEYEHLYRESGQFHKEGPEILLSWAKALTEAGQYLAAADKFELFRKTYPGNKDGPRTLLDEGQAYLSDRKTDQAIAQFREIISRFSGTEEYRELVGEAYFGLGGALESNGDLSAALEAYKQSLSLYPNRKVIQLKIDRVMKRKKERQL